MGSPEINFPPKPAAVHLDFTIAPQPDDETCGPACLHGVYGYYNTPATLDEVIQEVRSLPQGGTLAVHLARHAMARGYDATIYTCNLQMFDPTWFGPVARPIQERLRAQMNLRVDEKLRSASEAYIDYLDHGGRLFMEDVTPTLIGRLLAQRTPVIAGLSATWLYRCARERATGEADDIGGEPTGHFVVLHGIDAGGERVRVADPWSGGPGDGSRPEEHLYEVDVHRVIGAILLGIVTYDAKLLVIRPRIAIEGLGA